ncbi:MAG TPA: serine/threonine-protein kinase [Gemmatimonadaceae bacterium]|nr:serine/threonine-protein kinase [Gemmatimonadaceae bacterium]
MESSVQTANAFDISVVRSALDTDYEVLEELGRGGMAVVYLAKERSLDREVAIKVLPAILSLDQDFVERFLREARTAGQLEHPNIVPVYRVGQVGQIIFFVMKLLRGQSLAGVLRERGKLPAADVRRILLETSSALGYAAKRGVVHRDIKPDNIMLDAEGRCVVTDFGIAKTSSGPRTAAGTSMGTPRYMSPEHAQGIPVDGRSDIYSLGIVAYELLTGATPFTGEDPFAVLYKHINAPLPIPTLETDEEKRVFSVIERMLAKSADDRYQHAYELIAALGGDTTSTTLIAGGVPILQATTVPTEIIHTGRLERFRRKLRSDRRLWFASGAALVAVILLAVFWPRAKAPAAQAASLGQRSAGDSTRALTTVAGATTAVASPAGTPVASAVAGTTSGAKVPAVDTKSATKVASTPRRTAPPPYSRCVANPKEFGLLVDSVKKPEPGNALKVSYDICGLPASTAYSGQIKLTRKGSFGRWGSVVTERLLGITLSRRHRLTYTVADSLMRPGTYRLEVAIETKKTLNSKPATVVQEFEIKEKK